MKHEDAVAHEMLEWLSYDPTTGIFLWVRYPRGKAKMGSPAGTVDDEGYRKIRLHGKSVRAHRLAWFFMTGSLPDFEIDHEDGDRDNNSLRNLRPCRTFENNQNKPIISTNTSGIPGVHFCRKSGKWRARIMILGRRISLGSFHDIDEARAAYMSAKSKHHLFNPHVRTP